MRVLLATDGSDDARMAAAWLTHFPLPAVSRVRVVSVVSIPASSLDLPTVRDFVGTLREDARHAAEAAQSALAARFPDAEVQVLEGDARQTILRAAEEWPAELVVLGARGLGAVAGFLLGSVSLAVARHAPCSVLVVKGGARGLRGTLVAIDGSEHARAAAAFLAGLPLDPAVVVKLVGVVEVPPYPATTPGFASGMVREAIKDIVRSAGPRSSTHRPGPRPCSRASSRRSSARWSAEVPSMPSSAPPPRRAWTWSWSVPAGWVR
jgi:nucleotide-binding universal stress UspA family protein